MHTAYIALGSNLGDRHANFATAIAALAKLPGITVVRVAKAIETLPVDCPPDSPAFLNSALEVSTTKQPTELLADLHWIESGLGRARTSQNAPRPIDLDILFFDDLVLTTATLVIPHPRMHERRFVLAPLAQIAPEVVHPIFRKTIAELLAALPADRS